MQVHTLKNAFKELKGIFHDEENLIRYGELIQFDESCLVHEVEEIETDLVTSTHDIFDTFVNNYKKYVVDFNITSANDGLKYTFIAYDLNRENILISVSDFTLELAKATFLESLKVMKYE